MRLTHAYESEAAALGSMILSVEAAAIVAKELVADDFYTPQHQMIFATICDLVVAEAGVDMVLIVKHMQGKGTLDRCGGVDYLVELFESVPSAVSALYYARIVKDMSLRRQTHNAAAIAVRDAYNTEDTGIQHLDGTISTLMSLRPSTGEREGRLSGFMDNCLLPDANTLMTGIRPLDDIMDGYEPGTFNLIAARPSEGKTALAIAMALHLAEQGVGVGFISAEMRGDRIARRFVCQKSGLNMKKVKSNQLSTAEMARGIAARDAIKQLPIWMDDTPAIKLGQLQAQARQWCMRHDIKVLIVDYVQLMGKNSKLSVVEAIDENIEGIKTLNRDLNVVGINLAQINRSGAEGGWPQMHQIKGTGGFEQAADTTTIIHQDKESQCTKLIIGKNRDGERGVCDVKFDGPTGRFLPLNDRTF